MADVIYMDETDSTNRYAADHFDALRDGSLVAAGRQTAGRGRLGRKWTSPEGSIYASFVMKELPETPFYATMCASLAVLGVLRDFAPEIKPFIKWPNDVYVGVKKICGILSEGVIRSGKVSGIVCGMGVNVNLSPSALREISNPAASVLAETGRITDLRKMTDQLALYLDWFYITALNSKRKLYENWKRENALIGSEVVLAPPAGPEFSAVIADIGTDGRLHIRRENGETSVFDCGDVKIIPENAKRKNKK